MGSVIIYTNVVKSKTTLNHRVKIFLHYLLSYTVSTLSTELKGLKIPLARELLLPLAKDERRRHKLKRLVQHPNSYFMDVKCPGCYRITTVFSHAQTVVVCSGCSTVLCQSTGGRARLTEGCSFRRKSQK